jgi:hypothetical protein
MAAAERLGPDLPKGPTICLATAHPAKFPEAVCKAIGREPERPESLKGIESRPSRCKILPAEVDAVKNYIIKQALWPIRFLKRLWGPVNFWGLDPLYVANEGKLVAFVDPNDVNKVLEKMKGNEYSTEAQIIGQVVADYQGKVFMKTG